MMRKRFKLYFLFLIHCECINMSFLVSVQQVYHAFSNSSANSTTPVCTSAIDHYLFYQWMMLPAGLSTIFLAFFIKRKNKCLHILGGRPGLLYPLNIFTLENRYTVAAAFGSISFILADIVLEAKYAIDFSGAIWLRIFVILGSAFIYGVAFFPLFAGLATRSLVGYGLAGLFAWMYAIVDVYKSFECDLDAKTRMLVVVRNLPKAVSSVFLSISLTFLCLQELRKIIHRSEKVSEEVIDGSTSLQQIRESHYGKHVRAFFIPPPPPPKPKDGFFGKIQNILGPFVQKWIYHLQPNFRYPSRVIAIYTACFIIIYKVTCEILIIFVPLLEIYEVIALSVLDEIGYEYIPGEEDYIAGLRDFTYFIYYFILVLKGCLITASCLAFLLGVLMTLHSLSSYRVNLRALFRGDHTFIPGREEKSNVSMLVSTVRYAGYQIGYTAWAYVIHWFVFFLITFVIATIITLLANGYAHIVVGIIAQMWPIPVNIIVMLLFQMLVTKFVFSQENGNVFGITNRRGFFIFAYFMFFYNIFLGIISCLLRIVKGMGVGALLLGRLDQSTLSRKWQWFDPGFDAYLGFLHTENYQINPTVHTFIALLQLKTPKYTIQPEHTQISEGGAEDLEKGEKIKLETPKTSSTRARTRWNLAYSLHNNPQLRTKRKQYMQYLKEKLEGTYERMEKEKRSLKEKDNFTLQNGLYMIHKQESHL